MKGETPSSWGREGSRRKRSETLNLVLRKDQAPREAPRPPNACPSSSLALGEAQPGCHPQCKVFTLHFPAKPASAPRRQSLGSPCSQHFGVPASPEG